MAARWPTPGDDGYTPSDDGYTPSSAEAAVLRRMPAGDELDRSIVVLLDEHEGETAAAGRMGRALGSLVDEEAATFLGTLLDLAESGAYVTLGRHDAAKLHGTIRVVGTDVVGVERDALPLAWIALDTIDDVTPSQTRVPARGDRQCSPATMQSALFDRVGERPQVAIRRKADGPVLTGTLVSCGADVCSIRTEAGADIGQRGAAVVRLRIAAIAEVVFLDD